MLCSFVTSARTILRFSPPRASQGSNKSDRAEKRLRRFKGPVHPRKKPGRNRIVGQMSYGLRSAKFESIYIYIYIEVGRDINEYTYIYSMYICAHIYIYNMYICVHKNTYKEYIYTKRIVRRQDHLSMRWVDLGRGCSGDQKNERMER